MAIALIIAALLCFTASGIGCLMAQGKKHDGSTDDCKITEKVNIGICTLGAAAAVTGMFSFVFGFMTIATIALVLATPMFMLASYKCGYAFMITLLR
ncbi:MAG: hypothetical protein VX730_08570 [Pseudomonadota bacterium]|nr:hypothetical protein [Pseudomonadota bacterium]